MDFAKLLDFVFPPSTDEKLVSTCSRLPRAETRTPDGHTALCSFKDPTVRAAVHLAKFHRHPKAISLLAATLYEYLAAQPAREFVILPVPLSTKRQRTRGFNQVTEILKQLPSSTSYSVDDTSLQRIRHTPPQTSLDKQARKLNLTDAFALTNGETAEKLNGRDILIVDDVTTTGATLSAASTPLKHCSPRSVTCLALAH